MDDQDATMAAIQSRPMLSWKGEKGLGKKVLEKGIRGFLQMPAQAEKDCAYYRGVHRLSLSVEVSMGLAP